MRLTEIRGRAGTKAELLRQFTSGKYDIVHFAGHAFFDANYPAHSGILCANSSVVQIPVAQLVAASSCEDLAAAASQVAEDAARARPDRPVVLVLAEYA